MKCEIIKIGNCILAVTSSKLRHGDFVAFYDYEKWSIECHIQKTKYNSVIPYGMKILAYYPFDDTQLGELPILPKPNGEPKEYDFNNGIYVY